MNSQQSVLEKLDAFLTLNTKGALRFGRATDPPPGAVWHKGLRCMLVLGGTYAPTCRLSSGSTPLQFHPGDQLCMMPHGWTLPNWSSAHELFGIVINDAFVRCLWYKHPGDGRALPTGPQRWHHTSSAPPPALRAMAEALKALGSTPHQPPTRQQVFRAFLLTTRECLENDRPLASDRSRSRWQAVFDHLERNCHVALDRNTVASRFRLHPNTLSRLFSKYANETFSACLTRLRIERAKELLRNPELNVDEVAARCGFSGTSYFIKSFRKHCGITPGMFRSQQQEA